jgi:hypothetical protein
LASFARRSWQKLPKLVGTFSQNFSFMDEEAPVALLKPPDPQIPRRKYYVRIEEPLALTMERYAELLGASSADHVIAQALEFVFRKDSDFKQWLAAHPQPAEYKAIGRKKPSAATHVAGKPNGREEASL